MLHHPVNTDYLFRSWIRISAWLVRILNIWETMRWALKKEPFTAIAERMISPKAFGLL